MRKLPLSFQNLTCFLIKSNEIIACLAYNTCTWQASLLWKLTQWKKVKLSSWLNTYIYIFAFISRTANFSQSESSNREKLWLLKSYNEKFLFDGCFYAPATYPFRRKFLYRFFCAWKKKQLVDEIFLLYNYEGMSLRFSFTDILCMLLLQKTILK